MSFSRAVMNFLLFSDIYFAFPPPYAKFFYDLIFDVNSRVSTLNKRGLKKRFIKTFTEGFRVGGQSDNKTG